ncbi:MAG: hypothetical protein IKE45_14800 [Halomonas sp.]|nr:glycosyltransferase [Halomonas sp.]MBR2515252.1 hypothetical protein [Halomonas sp.]
MKVMFTAGTQFAFPRMAEVVQGVARLQPEWALVFQAGPGATLETFTEFSNVQAAELFTADRFQEFFDAADLVVTHAGMGNIIACLEHGKPCMLLPRQARLGEHRNDHQIDTARAITQRYPVPVFNDTASLAAAVLAPANWPVGLKDAPSQMVTARAEFTKGLNQLLQVL